MLQYLGRMTVTPGISHDPLATTLGSFTPRYGACGCLIICPGPRNPVELFFSFLKMVIFLGYGKSCGMPSRINRNRQKIYDCITANPGVKFNALERLTGIKEGTLKYHLLLLVAKRKVISFGGEVREVLRE